MEQKWGTWFVNAAALLRRYNPTGAIPKDGFYPYTTGTRNVPKSRLLTFTEGSADVLVQCYLHTSDHAPQGWYAPAERTIRLGKPFRLLPDAYFGIFSCSSVDPNEYRSLLPMERRSRSFVPTARPRHPTCGPPTYRLCLP